MRARVALAVLAGSAACLAGSAAIVGSGSRAERHASVSEELLYFPSGRFLRQAALGHETLVADLAWLRAIQYYGEHRKTDRRYPRLQHIFDVVTTLDPQFVNAYAFGGLVLAQDAGEVDAGLALIEKGMTQNPESWLLPFEAGFLYYVTVKDLKRASQCFARAARRPGCPDYVARFAAHTTAEAGYTVIAIRLWREIARTTENAEIRRMAERKIEELEKEGGNAGA